MTFMRTVLFIGLLFLAQTAPGQLAYTVNNQAKYASGSDYLHRENLLDINLFSGDWTVYSQLEYSRPPEFGNTFTGIHKFRLEYLTDNLDVKLGHVYPLWNRGLVLNLRYERDLGYDSGLLGFESSYALSDHWRFMAAGGKQNYELSSPTHEDLRGHDWTESAWAGGAGIEYSGQTVGTLALDFFYGEIRRPYHALIQTGSSFQTRTEDRNTRSLAGEIFWNKKFGGIDLIVNPAVQITTLPDIWTINNVNIDENSVEQSRGYAFYSALSANPGGVGMTLEYKNYAYDLRPPGIWQDIYRDWPTRMTALQRPPIVYREHSETLIGRQTHNTNFNDETGFQLDLNYYTAGGLFLNGNVSVASRHRAYTLDNRVYVAEKESPLLPAFSPEFFPYAQGHLQGERGFFNDRVYILQAVNYLWKVEEFSRRINPSESGEVQQSNTNAETALTLLTKLDYTFPRGHSVALYFESQQLDRIFRTERIESTSGTLQNTINENVQPVYNRLITTSFRHPAGITVSLLYDVTSQTETGREFNTNHDQDNPLESLLRTSGVNLRNKWFGIETTVDVIPSHQMSLFYGSEQGGLQCANGVCREVPPFEDGFKITLQSYF